MPVKHEELRDVGRGGTITKRIHIELQQLAAAVSFWQLDARGPLVPAERLPRSKG